MRASRRRRLFIVIGIGLIVSLSIAMILIAMRENISLYYSPKQLQHKDFPSDRLFRLGGQVLSNSLHQQKLTTVFVVTDGVAQVTVHYRGVLPDLFKEGSGMVAEGHLNPEGIFIAQTILAKHDENYHPPDS